MGYQTYIFDLYGTLIDIHTDEEDLKVTPIRNGLMRP